MKRSASPLAVLVFSVFFALASAWSQSSVNGWPRTFINQGTSFTVYQPQATSWTGNTLTFRAAVSATPQGAAKPVFGTVVLSAQTETDLEGQTLSLTSVSVAQANFPTAAESAQSYADAVATQESQWAIGIPLQTVKASLAVTAAEGGTQQSVPVQNSAPTIFFSQTSAVLVLIDGQPALRPVQGTSLLRAINTQALLVMDQSSGTYYLRVNGTWAQAVQVGGPWTPTTNAPASLATVLAQAASISGIQLFDPPAGSSTSPMPAIYTSTGPAELVTTEGAPAYEPVPGTQLLHVSNSGSAIFMDTTTLTLYVVISGRWFAASSFGGPWQFVPANQLPADFAKIPETAPSGAVLASVSGTPQAREAAISATIPQTATISRTATTTVNYAGGEPDFAPIPQSELAYARNTSTPVVKVASDKFYAVVNGVWFVSASATGPWSVAASVPPAIYKIPPSSPVYYATNVYVYDSTPDVVTVGYTPGYFGACLSPEGVVVYGTGYAYPPYIGPDFWVGPPLTYGFGAGFACGLATGFAFGLAVDHGWGCSPWWGPWHGGWYNANHNVTVNNWNNVNVNRYNAYNRWGNNVVRNTNISQNNINNARNDINANRVNNARNDINANRVDNARNDLNANRVDNARNNINADRADNGRLSGQHPTRDVGENHPDVDRQSLSRNSSGLGDNNVFAGKDGNAYRAKTDGGWEQHNNGSWADASHSSFSEANRQDLDSQRFSRNVGGFRDSGGFGGGGFRGGGGGFGGFHGGRR